MTETKPRRGRPAKVKIHGLQAENQTQAETKAQGRLKVKVADAIHDGEGGFYPVGHMFDPADDAAEAMLKARGLAE